MITIEDLKDFDTWKKWKNGEVKLVQPDFTLYPEAFELKELGFDEPCFAWYVSESYGLEYGEVIKSDLIRDGIIAPTYSQAFRWFRENHNLHAWIINAEDNHNVFKPFFRGDNIYDQHLVDFYDSYEEAELACLKKLIEIVKGGKK
jgi:hypothetical protein